MAGTSGLSSRNGIGTAMLAGLKEKKTAKAVYIFLVTALLLRYLVLMFFADSYYFTPDWVVAIQITAAILGVYLGKTWKDKGFILYSLYIVLMLCRILFDQPAYLRINSVRHALFLAVWSIGGCYSLGRVASRDQLKKGLRVFAALWTLLSVIHCGMALYAAWTGKVIWNLSHDAFWGLGSGLGSGKPGYADQNATGAGNNVRLYIVHYFTVGGQIFSISAVLAFCAFLCEKRKCLKGLYLLSLIVILTAVSLTDSRTGHISAAVGMSMATGLYGLQKYQARRERKGPLPKWKNGAFVTVLLLAVLVLTVAFIWLIGEATQVFNDAKAGKALLPVSTAFAETAETAPTQVASRGYFGDLNRVLSGRPVIWEHIIRYLGENPRYLLTGVSLYDPMKEINRMPTMPFPAGHAHNALLQILLIAGIPGLLLFLGLIYQVVRAMMRLLKTNSSELWEKCIIALVVSVWTGEMAECVAQVLFSQCRPNCAILFSAMGILCGLYGNKARKVT